MKALILAYLLGVALTLLSLQLTNAAQTAAESRAIPTFSSVIGKGGH